MFRLITQWRRTVHAYGPLSGVCSVPGGCDAAVAARHVHHFRVWRHTSG